MNELDSLEKDLQELKINLVDYEYFINRIHERYPSASKIEIIQILNSFLNSLRKFIVLGQLIVIQRLFSIYLEIKDDKPILNITLSKTYFNG